MVDDVCLFRAREESIVAKYSGQINDLENSAEMDERQVIEELLKSELESLQLRSVPLKVKKEEVKTKK
jgi:hypothetical protein